MGRDDATVGVGYRVAALVPSLVVAKRNVSRAKLRSALAAASILIGVVAIGAIGAGGTAFKQAQLDRVQAQGATSVYVAPGVDKDPRSFDAEDVRAIEETVGGGGVVATRSDSAEFVVRPGERESLSVTYIEDPRALYEVGQGSLPTNWRQSVVLSRSFADQHGVRLGDRLTVVWSDEGTTTREEHYRVVAVLAETPAFGVDDAFLPLAEAENGDQYEQIRVTTQSATAAETAADRLRERFNGRKDRLLVFELTSLLRLFKQIVTGINTFLVGLGAVSLLVAGVSITNTMLMAVIERRQEIGVLRSVGYTKADVVRIVLAEAALIGLIGAAVGVALAALAGAVANAVFLGDPLAFSPTALAYLAGAALFGVGTSLLAGVYPAWRAANERPVEALRG
jgi:putative ABC transport system permease protein